MSGQIVHFEIPFDDQDRASAFYEQAFDWQLASMPGMGYTLVTTGPVQQETGPTEPGYINGGMLQRQDPITSPVLVIDVGDIDATLTTDRRAGRIHRARQGARRRDGLRRLLHRLRGQPHRALGDC